MSRQLWLIATIVDIAVTSGEAGNVAPEVGGTSLLSTAGRLVTIAGKESESWNILASKGYIPVFLYPAMVLLGQEEKVMLCLDHTLSKGKRIGLL